MNNKKGFTLIELIGMIIILGLLVIIGVPALLKNLKDNKTKEYESFKKNLFLASEAYLSENLEKYEDFNKAGDTIYIPLILLKENEYIDGEIYNPKTETNVSMYEVVKVYYDEDNNLQYEYYDKFPNGAVIYYDVLTGKACNNYHELNSLTGYNGIINELENEDVINSGKHWLKNSKAMDLSMYSDLNDDNSVDYKDIILTIKKNQTSCLKFYVFNDASENESVNMILDHNITNSYSTVKPTSKENYKIQDIMLYGLNDSTKDWNGTITPEKYSVDIVATDKDRITSRNVNYTLDYSNYKARLITAEEIAKITGADKKVSWPEGNLNKWELSTARWYYSFDTLANNTYYDNNLKYYYDYEYNNEEGRFVNRHPYGWLFDRLSSSDFYKDKMVLNEVNLECPYTSEISPNTNGYSEIQVNHSTMCDCKIYGCYNSENYISMPSRYSSFCYLTSSVSSVLSEYNEYFYETAWLVYRRGYLDKGTANIGTCGVRPVIKVPKKVL